MLERALKYLLMAAIAAGPLAGCSYMTQSGRQQMAYQRYVRKFSKKKVKMQKKVKPAKMPMTPGPSANKISTQVSEAPGPQSVSSGDSQ